MSKLAEVAYDIEQLYIEGFKPTSIAAQLDIPLSMVYDWLETVNVAADEEEHSPYSTINS
jgi:DNA-directed RNA polymerase specialized sigma24 family protein